MSSRTATVLAGVLMPLGFLWTAGCGSQGSVSDTPNAEQSHEPGQSDNETGDVSQIVTLEITGMS